MNLILNAADASRGTGEVIVEVWYKESAPQEAPYCGTMGFCVVDSGTGISPEVLKKIWNPFFTTKRDGTGLGLAVCRQIVEEHGGAIHISSSPGKRTVVSVSFPAKVAKREKTARSGDTPEDGQVEH
ncbi:MAG: HAMP domain-containing histidine kinase [Candidatus Hydrogenedentes bacterium]|nr:HAMP domain-containing histidine kinase [Candidatus Hydrogenedentota bacterium]